MNTYNLIKSLILFVNFILLLTFSFTSYAAKYIEVTPKSGQGMYVLFKKYHISPNACNISHFKEINRIKNVEKLLTGKQYQLPIIILPFNGKSIATSLPKSSKATAVNIMNYNKLAFNSKLRKKSYIHTKVIWVPYHELNCGAKSQTSSKLIVKSSPASIATKNSSKSVSKTKTSQEIKVVNTTLNIRDVNKIEQATLKKLEDEIINQREIIAARSEANLNYAANLRTRTVPIFGSDFAEIRVQSDLLKDKVYYLISGHGGPDPGTMYEDKKEIVLCEDEYAYDITLRLARKLMEHGANVHLIVQDPNDGIRNEKYLKLDRDERCITGYPFVLNQRLRLTQTTDAVNDLHRSYKKKGIPEKDQLAINIHIDSRQKEMRQDVFFYYQDNNKTSHNIAKRLQNTLGMKYAELGGRDYSGTISSRNLFVMRYTQPATVYIELGNLQNEADQKRFLFSSNRQALAEWLYDGVIGD